MQVILKMKSKHVVGTITKKKKSKLFFQLIDNVNKTTTVWCNIDALCIADIVLEVCKDMPAWPGRHLFDSGEQRCYFGLKTEARGIVEFECRNQREYDIWTTGVSNLLAIVAERKQKH